jgi:hypothetical protein
MPRRPRSPRCRRASVRGSRPLAPQNRYAAGSRFLAVPRAGRPFPLRPTTVAGLRPDHRCSIRAVCSGMLATGMFIRIRSPPTRAAGCPPSRAGLVERQTSPLAASRLNCHRGRVAVQIETCRRQAAKFLRSKPRAECHPVSHRPIRAGQVVLWHGIAFDRRQQIDQFLGSHFPPDVPPIRFRVESGQSHKVVIGGALFVAQPLRKCLGRSQVGVAGPQALVIVPQDHRLPPSPPPPSNRRSVRPCRLQ